MTKTAASLSSAAGEQCLMFLDLPPPALHTSTATATATATTATTTATRRQRDSHQEHHRRRHHQSSQPRHSPTSPAASPATGTTAAIAWPSCPRAAALTAVRGALQSVMLGSQSGRKEAGNSVYECRSHTFTPLEDLRRRLLILLVHVNVIFARWRQTQNSKTVEAI